jgi:hypothetical protein
MQGISESELPSILGKILVVPFCEIGLGVLVFRNALWDFKLYKSISKKH